MPESRVMPETMNETDVVELLVAQHAMIRDLFDEVERAPVHRRAKAFTRLVRLLAVHETVEEEIVHPYARLVLEDGEAVVDDRLAEEREAKELLRKMDQAGVDEPDFLTNLAVLRAAVTAHAGGEERYEFPRLRARTTVAQRRTLAAGVKAASALAPTHPHPGTESAIRNILVGTPIAMMDRARDVIRQAMGGWD
ncbi:hemerythrin domain-containing protein [Nonomuraea sp. NPDC048916]|uniref:hemerythrin domain-containing protein n=1 Tax=Nonomuraea sp. NPDC048916 TaxID=3154232 RepID=UPI0033EDF3E3